MVGLTKNAIRFFVLVLLIQLALDFTYHFIDKRLGKTIFVHKME